ncbi:putative mis6 domain protein [Neofusicoccum parvum UCRNP2]|uniref:Putative mis6 domain protein n=1 Tax=Botryosphaeria parva (strain UCR-NP2) TaxID=1287680 RepID=R1GS14_BOTPV|nr:putative mis6 domain protein [Neofusicoccum parvum UCRNP2]
MRAAIDALRAASTVPAKQRKEKASSVVDAVCSHAYQHGLSRDLLESIVQIVTRRNTLDQTSLTNLVKNLYPADSVSSDLVVTIIGALGQGQTKPSAATQAALLKWIIAVIDVLDDATVLSKLYGVLFNLLDTMSLRTPLCHLLSLVTRRKHVRPFRIQQLLELVRASGQDPALVGLLRVYKDYYPEIIVGNAASGRTSFASATQDEWRHRLQAIQEANAERTEQFYAQQNGFKVLLPTGQDFLNSYLPFWDGWTHSEAVLGLLTFVPMQDFEAEAAIVSSGTPDAYDRLLGFYTSLVQNWNHAANSSPETCHTSDYTSQTENFTALTVHTSNTILSLLTSQNHTPLTTTTSILTYYTTLSTLSSTLTPLTIPSAPTLYTLLFQPSLATLSHLCTLLATYKRAFEADLHEPGSGATLPRAVTNAFNGYLMDVANLLWRSRALTAADPNAMACLCPPSVAAALNTHLATLPPILIPDHDHDDGDGGPTLTPAPGTGPDYALPSHFGLANNALTAPLAAAALRDLEDAARVSSRHPPGPVTQRSLYRLARSNGGGGGGLELSWKAYRVRVLEWLAEHGVQGVRDFMFVTMKDLMREAAATATATAAGDGNGGVV